MERKDFRNFRSSACVFSCRPVPMVLLMKGCPERLIRIGKREEFPEYMRWTDFRSLRIWFRRTAGCIWIRPGWKCEGAGPWITGTVPPNRLFFGFRQRKEGLLRFPVCPVRRRSWKMPCIRKNCQYPGGQYCVSSARSGASAASTAGVRMWNRHTGSAQRKTSNMDSL